MSANLKVEWLDGGREPQHPPNPEYPDGIHVDISRNAWPVCRTNLPYPAKRCGVYVISCSVCGYRTAVTTAGRVDDPRSITIACDQGAAS